jgi:hypothetical protein
MQSDHLRRRIAMGTPRRVTGLLIAGVVLGLVIVGALSVRGGSQVTAPVPVLQAVCATAQPVAGGNVHLYVVDPETNVVSAYENGRFAASYQLPGHAAGHVGSYTVCSGSAEPVADGNAFCFVVDRDLRKVHAFANAEYTGTEDLPKEGDKIP